MKTYQFLSRIISLSGDVESNPFPTNRYFKSVPSISPTNSVSLLKFRLSQLSKTAAAEVAIAFWGLYHNNSMEIPKIISMCTVIALNI